MPVGSDSNFEINDFLLLNLEDLKLASTGPPCGIAVDWWFWFALFLLSNDSDSFVLNNGSNGSVCQDLPSVITLNLIQYNTDQYRRKHHPSQLSSSRSSSAPLKFPLLIDFRLSWQRPLPDKPLQISYLQILVLLIISRIYANIIHSLEPVMGLLSLSIDAL